MLSRFIVALILVICLPLKMNAAEISFNHLDDFDFVNVEGVIKPGDQMAIARLVASEAKNPIVLFAFNSPGGDLNEGVKIGQYIRKMNFHTAIFKNDICYSACFFSFIGGVKREVRPQGKLGVHQFYGGKGTSDYIESSTQYITSQLLEYTARMGVDIETMKLAFQTPPQGMYVFNKKELDLYNLNQHVNSAPPLPKGSLWYGDGWNVSFDDNSCIMSKFTAQKRFVGIMMQPPYLSLSISGDYKLFRAPKHPKNTRLQLVFDGGPVAEIIAFHFNTDLFTIALPIDKFIADQLSKKKTVAFVVDGELLEVFGLKGSAKALNVMMECNNLLQY